MKTKLLGVEKTSNGKYVKTYLAKYKTSKGEFCYEFASRKDVPDVLAKTPKPDAVRILPYFYDEKGQLQVVLIKEFRFPINKYVYALPAGIIDGEELPIESAKRELKEEIGADVVSIRQTEKASYSSAGFSDESIVTFEAEIKFGGKQHLETFEDITPIIVNLDTLFKMLDEEDFGAQPRLQLRCFYYKMKNDNKKRL